MKFVFTLIFLTLLTWPTALHAQITEPDKISNDKSLISVPVTVSDREGRYISGLKKEDFTIFQDGVKQKVDFFATYDEPLNIALLLDTSGSTMESLSKIKDAAKVFIELLNPNDQCLVATFDSQINILNPFTNSQELLKNSINKVKTADQDGTVLRYAVKQLAQISFTAPQQGRKVIILLSDGKDYGSAVTRDELMNTLEETDILIYTIFYKAGSTIKSVEVNAEGKVTEIKEVKKQKKVKVPKPPKGYVIGIPDQIAQTSDDEIAFREKKADIEGVDILRELSDITAGRFYLSDTPNLKNVFKQVAGELREQYRLGYRSKNVNEAGTHDITVKVGRPDVVVRTRGKFRAKQL
jgi:VWFA-related protein